MTAISASVGAALHLARSHSLAALSVCLALYVLYHLAYRPLVVYASLRHVPGPTLFAATRWRLALCDWRGTRTPAVHALHARYAHTHAHGHAGHGSTTAVRVGPAELSFASPAALRAIYGAGSGFERTAFYRMFDVYGRQNLFTFAGARAHGERKKVLAHAYAKSAILSPRGAARPLVERHAQGFLDLIEREPAAAREIFRSLHWFSLDSITGFLYGNKEGGATRALHGDAASRALLDDIIDPRRRALSWFAVHLPAYTAWLYGRRGLAGRVVAALGLLPMPRPATYTGIRAHALAAWEAHEKADANADGAGEEKKKKEQSGGGGGETEGGSGSSIAHRLRAHQLSGRAPRLDGLDCASEAADHFLAGIDTTSDTLMFLIWQLSRPEHAAYQDRLVAEARAVPAAQLNADGNPTAEAADRLPWLDALIRETLRLHAPLPAAEPRVLPGADAVVDGVRVPAGTVVSVAPYTLHRNADVFPDPLAFRPERWLGEQLGELGGDLAEMKKHWWAFSSGGRMCIGMHLAMAEMTTLMAALYRRYRTRLQPRQEGVSPGITSRFEVFHDETFSRVSEHACWIDFVKQ
ncbi:cytochrome P450 [Xylariaceae sp. FL0804]|nr:cytochrome P450 [Xylariaceae sp. FL0804]